MVFLFAFKFGQFVFLGKKENNRRKNHSFFIYTFYPLNPIKIDDNQSDNQES